MPSEERKANAASVDQALLESKNGRSLRLVYYHVVVLGGDSPSVEMSGYGVIIHHYGQPVFRLSVGSTCSLPLQRDQGVD